MPIFLCYDPSRRKTPWAAEKYRSMTTEFTKRRIKYFTVSTPEELEGYLKEYPGEASSIVFFPSSEPQRQYLFNRYGKFNINKIIFSHQDVGVAETNFSYIMSDFYGDMELAISHLREKGCKSIALFCANLDSYHDRMRADTYNSFVGDSALIFETTDKIYPALESLMKCNERIDAIICVNDFVAFCLMLVLDELDKNWREKLLVMSFSNSIISGLCSPSLTSISFNYIDGGKEVATIHRALEKNNRMAYMNIIMKSQLYARETTEKENPAGMVFSEYRDYDYETMKSIIAPQKKCMALEKLLALSDPTDLEIMQGLISNMTFEDIAKKLFLTREAIKYRVKKFKDYLKIDKTKEITLLLKRWISAENLDAMIKKQI